jgi:hypothetical protein
MWRQITAALLVQILMLINHVAKGDLRRKISRYNFASWFIRSFFRDICIFLKFVLIV